MAQKTKTQTYVAFIVPDNSAPQKGIAIPFVVENRDLRNLDVPAAACAFYFYDAPEGMTPQQSMGDQKNVSKVYLLAHEVLAREDIKKLIGGEDHATLSGRMQWDPRIEQNDAFVITRSNAIQPVTDRHIVIDARMRQVYPPLPAAAAKNTRTHDIREVFNPVLQKDLLVPKLGDVRRRARPPQSPPPAP